MSSTSLMMERSTSKWDRPVADAFDTGNGTSDVINMKDHNRVRFLYHWGVGATGTSHDHRRGVRQRHAVDDESAIPFKYRVTPAAGHAGHDHHRDVRRIHDNGGFQPDRRDRSHRGRSARERLQLHPRQGDGSRQLADPRRRPRRAARAAPRGFDARDGGHLIQLRMAESVPHPAALSSRV
jgi:hypothetical protein